MPQDDIFIGLMSGTSLDAIDAVACQLYANHVEIIATYHQPIATELKQQLLYLSSEQTDAKYPEKIQLLGQLDTQLGQLFADTVLNLLIQHQLCATQIKAIGSHGQTIRHHPDLKHGFSLQIADPNRIAQLTGITTIADFRRRDLVVNGQGAPLVPAFHQALFYKANDNRVVINIGGMANITVLATNANQVIGFDTGPGNVLLDTWIGQHQEKAYDHNGDWAKQGQINQILLQQFLNDPYFQLPPPKSTGREYFHIEWLKQFLKDKQLSSIDIQTTLTELTAMTISQAIKKYAPATQTVLICGGGANNQYLLQRISQQLDVINISTTKEYGLDPQWVEATAFAWLAKQTLNRLTGNLPSVTGATLPVILGGIYYS